jgi:hypothetical protein
MTGMHKFSAVGLAKALLEAYLADAVGPLLPFGQLATLSSTSTIASHVKAVPLPVCGDASDTAPTHTGRKCRRTGDVGATTRSAPLNAYATPPPSADAMPAVPALDMSRHYGSHIAPTMIDLVVDTMGAVLKISPRRPGDVRTPELAHFVRHALASSQANVVTVVLALIYVERFKQRLPPKSKGDHDTPHRLFFVALVLASKFLYDQTLTNRAWAKVSGALFTVTELNTMEADFLGLLQYDLYVQKHAFDTFVDAHVAGYDRALAHELQRLHGPLFQSNLGVAAY